MRAGDVLADLASLRTRSAGTFGAPLVVLAPFTADLPVIPGLRVAVAATADDLVGLIGHALAAGDPVVVLHSAAALDDAGEGAPVPGLGVAVTRRAGNGVTVLAVGDGVAAALAAEGEAEVLDLRALSSLDTAAIGASVRRTGRAVAVGAPQALLTALDQAFLSLESPLSSLPAAASPADVSAAVARALSY
jgi:pyruvate dehydrogenase E1 component beta subunit